MILLMLFASAILSCRNALEYKGILRVAAAASIALQKLTEQDQVG